jgi:hypothetical protein
MKEISLYEAYSFLQQCPVVMLEGRPIEPTLMGYEDEDSNEFMSLSWEEEWEDELVNIEVVFVEGDNNKVELDGCVLSLVNSDGDQEEITLLKEFYAEQA